MEYKKSYRGFIVWLVAYCIAGVGASFLHTKDYAAVTRIVLNVAALGVVLLTGIIYKTESVYWYNGTSFEAAREAGSRRRKIFAGKHLKRFAIFSLAFLLFSFLAHVLKISTWIDTIVFAVGLCAAAISTMSFKL